MKGFLKGKAFPLSDLVPPREVLLNGSYLAITVRKLTTLTDIPSAEALGLIALRVRLTNGVGTARKQNKKRIAQRKGEALRGRHADFIP